MYPEDIERWINEKFAEPERAKAALAPLAGMEFQRERVMRSILSLSESDYDSVVAWARKAKANPKHVIGLAEYDNREVRKFNFHNELFSQKPYSYTDEA
ncbi:hypothetical protein CWE12_01230 [Aliidiomarina sedimenti]|uniref:Uncharacterized protein n=1 Tax=Aliidiomarina sedimenti TaxID=1933879 RepID=A0ABY0C1A4_9GAMM|nr:hypothetical protein [Aliidiomarina sedimenti]RUO31650.1 hypothetical protein CWE12_01230 [Aliidiomarina sedimenti]